MPAPKPLVALDLDDLIYPFMRDLVPFHNRVHNTSLTAEDFFTFEFNDVWGGSRQEAFDRVRAFFDQHDPFVEPLDGSRVALDKIRDRYDLIVVTARDDSYSARTLAWLDHHFPGHFESVHLCNTYMDDDYPNKRTKAEVCIEKGAVALVDDSYTNISQFAESGGVGILYGDFSWNRRHPLPSGVTRAVDWSEVVDQLSERVQ